MYVLARRKVLVLFFCVVPQRSGIWRVLVTRRREMMVKVCVVAEIKVLPNAKITHIGART